MLKISFSLRSIAASIFFFTIKVPCAAHATSPSSLQDIVKNYLSENPDLYIHGTIAKGDYTAAGEALNSMTNQDLEGFMKKVRFADPSDPTLMKVESHINEIYRGVDPLIEHRLRSYHDFIRFHFINYDYDPREIMKEYPHYWDDYGNDMDDNVRLNLTLRITTGNYHPIIKNINALKHDLTYVTIKNDQNEIIGYQQKTPSQRICFPEKGRESFTDFRFKGKVNLRSGSFLLKDNLTQKVVKEIAEPMNIKTVQIHIKRDGMQIKPEVTVEFN